MFENDVLFIFVISWITINNKVFFKCFVNFTVTPIKRPQPYFTSSVNEPSFLFKAIKYLIAGSFQLRNRTCGYVSHVLAIKPKHVCITIVK